MKGVPISSTETVNPRSRGWTEHSVSRQVDLFIQEEREVEKALKFARKELSKLSEQAGISLERGGRVFYVGAGTSGRLGVLDASEIPPTFGLPPNRVVGIMAGGKEAVFKSKEGAEDDQRAGSNEIDKNKINENDLVIGITASGKTPFVLSALKQAKKRGAKTGLIYCNSTIPKPKAIDFPALLPTGPELLAGSTRLKAGTATKVALNIISTLAMIRIQRVSDNQMSHVQPTNKKLRERAIRLVCEIGGCDRARALRRLNASGWNVAVAIRR